MFRNSVSSFIPVSSYAISRVSRSIDYLTLRSENGDSRLSSITLSAQSIETAYQYSEMAGLGPFTNNYGECDKNSSELVNHV